MKKLRDVKVEEKTTKTKKPQTLEERVMERANFLYICKYHGTKKLRDCVNEAIHDVSHLEQEQFCSLFGIYQRELDQFIDYICEIMEGK